MTAKTILGVAVNYMLNASDARMLNEQRNAERPKLEAGQHVVMKIEFDHGGDCVDGMIKHDGAKLFAERRNRGFGQGQWDWRDTASKAA